MLTLFCASTSASAQGISKPLDASAVQMELTPLSVNDPFPYAFGVGLSIDTYNTVRRTFELQHQAIESGESVIHLQDSLITAQDTRIASLTAIEKAQRTNIADLTAQAQTSARRADSTTAELVKSHQALLRLIPLLPRRVIRKLGPNPSATAIVGAVVEKAEADRKKLVNQSVGGLLVGALLSALILL